MGIKAVKQAVRAAQAAGTDPEAARREAKGQVQVSLHMMNGKGGFTDRTVNMQPQFAALFDHGGLVVARFAALSAADQYAAMQITYVGNAIRLNAQKVADGSLDIAIRNWLESTLDGGVANGTLSPTAKQCPTDGLPGVVYA